MLDKENLEKLERVKKNLAGMSSNPSGNAYDFVVSALNELATKTLKGKTAYLEKLNAVITKLDTIAESYAQNGQSKVGSKFTAVRNKLLPLRNKVEAGKVKDVNTIKTVADSAQRDIALLSPKSIDSAPNKAGIKDQKRAFAGFNKKKVKLEIPNDKAFELKKVPMLLVFKNKISPTQKKILKVFNAHFYDGTNGVSLPEVPVIVLNKNKVSKEDRKKAINSIFKMLHRPDLSAFTEMATERGNAVAIPVFEPKTAEAMSVILFDSTQSKELWIE